MITIWINYILKRCMIGLADNGDSVRSRADEGRVPGDDGCKRFPRLSQWVHGADASGACQDAQDEAEEGEKRKTDEVISHVGHHFVLTIINIPTACEICTSFFMWPLERGLVCQSQSLHLSLFYLTPITQRDSITTLRQAIFNYKSFLFVTIIVV